MKRREVVNWALSRKYMDTQERRTLAVRASQTIARDYGVSNGVPKILKDTNHTIVHLWPSPIVAKVSTKKIFLHRSTSLDREVTIAGLLAASGAPVLSPATSLPPGPHRLDGVELTFWNYCKADETHPSLYREVGKTLRAVHDALGHLKDRLPVLPSFKLQLEEADDLLRGPAAIPHLPAEDRLFLNTVHRSVMEDLGDRAMETRAIHGDCHAGQTIATASGLLWLDFEAACQGPKEWDVAGLDRRAAKAYGPIDAALLSVLKIARLLCVTTWCWTQPERDTEIREAAELHLKYLKRHGPAYLDR